MPNGLIDGILNGNSVRSFSKNADYGDAALFISNESKTTTYLMLAIVLFAIVFISFQDFPRIEMASGVLAPQSGVSTIVPTRLGTVVEINVAEGDVISRGTKLVTVKVEEDGADERNVGVQIDNAIEEQLLNISEQMDAVDARSSAAMGRVEIRRQAALGEIGSLREQIAIQRQLISSLEDDLQRIRPIAERGFVSGNEMRRREDDLLLRRQALVELQQRLTTKISNLSEMERDSAQLEAESRSQRAVVGSQRAQTIQERARNLGMRSYVLRAPIGGQVTAVTARVGQAAQPQISLMSIVPASAVLEATLYVRSKSIGFMKPGMEVRLAIDAFPYQRFGTLRGTVKTVARSAVERVQSDGRLALVYPVTVELNDRYVTAFGRREPLMSGMTLEARIIAERQTLLQWIFEPIYAVRER